MDTVLWIVLSNVVGKKMKVVLDKDITNNVSKRDCICIYIQE